MITKIKFIYSFHKLKVWELSKELQPIFVFNRVVHWRYLTCQILNVNISINQNTSSLSLESRSNDDGTRVNK
jgi:hypothetical protein